MSQTKSILVAEDSSVIQTIMRKVLEFQDYEIEIVKNGEEVLEMMNERNFDAILMDLNMPQMDGITCTKAIRKLDDKAKSNVPIIAVTGNAKNYDIMEFRAMGIDEFIVKPIDFDFLVAKLAEIVNKEEEAKS
ncbi:MAG: response regulator [Bernardetiaceae bacterium]|nr:response regulator [Bernardetiaceae bacterium]